ncbi:BZ3500_MvSof-1268-A1-R1_Chr7-3g09574 [Microbotryum saponariae]|uniref:BZ3500_MvSof-1268-A1-R1_Chr7-3g09574 protein n=1 Tax=Microbotryum saponariae TaxID=289078 RepID=A0A2X0LNI1_9BASI|nr:BZ3501_MvSof-1269-A2-R1_Chr7-2g09297 [Microbotryum saponariae]SDA02228.1 BZ3500_MvSof-1268-A1-R1_Chr7-3g09574 [Microbotryum saponariae]
MALVWAWARGQIPPRHGGPVKKPAGQRKQGEANHFYFLFDTAGPNQHRRRWIWIWWACFCHPPPKCDHAARKTRSHLNVGSATPKPGRR